MRRPVFTALLCLVTLSALAGACASAGPTEPTEPTKPAEPAIWATEDHFAEAFPNAAMGMPLEQWQKTRPGVKVPGPGEIWTFRIEVVEKDPVPGVVEATWYFDVDVPGHPLYEVIVDYGPNDAARKKVIEALGAPHDANGDWYFPTSHEHAVKVWAFKTKIISAANIRGTEWENEW
ncbi:MAG: hypothetical protein KC635_19570 [Myxococcales bacterium]|nr:hypothetical protein [Myxococcales bacterium]MCB9734683.1 hypothetical protein [Deltaproteobacteria bacterium]